MREQADGRRSFLHEGWVIANHILVSFHVAFISSILALPAAAVSKSAVLGFVFASPETLISALFTYISFHCGVALHEIGHFRKAARLRALNESVLPRVEEALSRPPLARALYWASVFLKAPYGRAAGIKREGLNYYVDAPYNLAVAAAGPRASRNVAAVALPPALALLAAGLLLDRLGAIYAGRLLLGIGVVTLLDFLLADPGKYAEFQRRERAAADSAAALPDPASWYAAAPAAKQRVAGSRMHEAVHPRLGTVAAPWQFRNCGMGGRHTEREYPESNISMQEAMFVILGAGDPQEAQETTVRLQNRLKEIIEKEDGCRVMGIGLEGGLAPYIDPADYPLPEVRLWAMMKQAIQESGLQPGVDVAIALDPAMSELEIAYRQEFDVPDSVGMYLFWRDQSKTVMDRDAVLTLYTRALRDYDIPILSIEDGFSEHDDEGWTALLDALGDRLLVVGDDLVTTNDRTIERAAERGLINAVLVKANQIGSLYETLLATLVTFGKGLETIVSHRSKSPNDDMEAHLALAFNALGLKAGGGANTERLVKYQAVSRLLARVPDADASERPHGPKVATVRAMRAAEEPTNAGIPTVGVEVDLAVPEADVALTFRGSTPLGTSAGTGEAVHLVDRYIEIAEDREPIAQHGNFFQEVERGVYVFRDKVQPHHIEAAADPALSDLYERARRYNGQGCMNAVAGVHQLIAPHFEDSNVSAWGLLDVDRALLALEIETARRRGKLDADASEEELIALMQRKQNLGMNAMLSVSLALARGIAHVQGKELHELLREEMLDIIARLAAAHGVAIGGSRFDDYLAALRQSDRVLAERGIALHDELRRLTGIYARPGEAIDTETYTLPAETVDAPLQPPAAIVVADPPPRPAAGELAARLERSFEDAEVDNIEALNRALYAAFGDRADAAARQAALRRYLETRSCVGRRTRQFGIANHRIFRSGDRLTVPYALGGALFIWTVRAGDSELIAQRDFPHGTIFTDELVGAVAGTLGEPIDLEREIYDFDASLTPDIRLTRIRDVAALLQRLNRCGSRHEAVYYLRVLVSRLCAADFQGFFSAKNLQPEVRQLNKELIELLDGPFAYRLRLPIRILTRKVSGLVSRPNLIDELWHDTIDLAEVHVRGSAITNELRRSAHHALGKSTLDLARSYHLYLESGDAHHLPESLRGRLSPIDEEARSRAAPRATAQRIAEALDKLLGGSQIITRLKDWEESYAHSLQRCESGNSLRDELEALVTGGIRGGNRWVYYHHLRALLRKADEGAWDNAAAPFRDALQKLQVDRPDDSSFDAAAAEHSARDAVETFADAIEADHQRAVFDALRRATDAYQHGAHFDAFVQISTLRDELEQTLSQRSFPEQRYLFYQLDCLLEEMGFFALRHVATSYEEQGLRLSECLRIIHMCAANLSHDGLFSRELWDLTVMLRDPSKHGAEILDVFEAVTTNYHQLVHRVSVAYEMMGRQLGLDDEEIRAIQGNFQRYLYDLNSMVHFTDLARARLQEMPQRERERDVPAAVAEDSPGRWDIVHLSHTDDIVRRVDSVELGENLQDRYGGKGSGLIYLSYLGIPTRDAFILPTTIPRSGEHLRDRQRLEHEVVEHLRMLEQDVTRADGVPYRFGDAEHPLLLAVRGGSVFTLPGMLTTLVFVGINDDVAAALARDDAWYAWDAYRRFLTSYAAAAWGVNLEDYELVEEAKQHHGVRFKQDLPAEALREVTEDSKRIIRKQGFGDQLDEILADPLQQLIGAVQVVFDSWDRERARRYRDIKGMSHSWHTAAIVQQMASGNRQNAGVLPGMDETAA
ncbi:MAG: PEP/pyruvate-binding domain-containing protein, partial [Acidobacteriota bacterium]